MGLESQQSSEFVVALCFMMETADGLMLCSVARYKFVGTRSLLAAVISCVVANSILRT